jgi:prephenate dehydrogenase
MTGSGRDGPAPVALIGLGALGGSLARALRALPAPPPVRAHALEAADLGAAVDEGVVDSAHDNVADAARGAAVLVLATPLGAEEAVLAEAAPVLAPDALALDVGSLQEPALEAARAAGLAARFVAGHPMAGSEASGFRASRADLFRDATVWLSAADECDDHARRRAERFWADVGARPLWTDAEPHDTRMAVVSHLPQVVANALSHVIAQGGFTVADLGPGGRDMTRLAASNPVLWRDLLEHSGPQVAALLRLLGRELDGWAGVLDGQDLDTVLRRMEATRRWREP